MTQFEIWKLITDFGLMGSLIYFAIRFLKNQSSANPHQLQELHSGLRSAIREADMAGKSLNEQLITRKQNLERLLSDFHSAESRLTSMIEAAEEKQSALDIEISRTSSKSKLIEPPARAAYSYQQPKNDLLAVEEDDQEEFAQAVSTGPKTNIFGETIGEQDDGRAQAMAEIEHAFSSTPLTTKIEKQIELTEIAQPKKKNSPEDVYAKAEELLKAGKAIDEVSSQTDLTADEVRMLSQMLDSDEQQSKANQQLNASDNRLGVLGGFKRQVQVL